MAFFHDPDGNALMLHRRYAPAMTTRARARSSATAALPLPTTTRRALALHRPARLRPGRVRCRRRVRARQRRDACSTSTSPASRDVTESGHRDRRARPRASASSRSPSTTAARRARRLRTRSSPRTTPRVWKHGLLVARPEGRRARAAALRADRELGRRRLALLAAARRRRGGRALHADRGVRVGRARPRRLLERGRRALRRAGARSSSTSRSRTSRARPGTSRTHHARVERDAELDWVAGGFGSKKGKIRIQNDLAGPGATSRVTGAYFADGDQHLDYDTFQEHIAPNTTSRLRLQGRAARRARRAVWRGMIRVEQDAQKTNAYQENRNLLLSPDGARRLDPGPRDPGQRRALHARRDARPGRPRASSST